MEKQKDPRDQVLIDQAIEITNLKLTVRQLKDDLLLAEEKRLTAQAELNKLRKEGDDTNEDETTL